MRILLLFLLAGSMAMVVAGAVVPGMFLLSLIGMVFLTGTAALGLAVFMRHSGPRVHY